MRSRVFESLLTVVLLGVPGSAAADDGDLRPLEVDDYFELRYPVGPQVSLDGERIAYTVSSQDLENDSRGTRIWMTATSGGESMHTQPRQSRG